jgi:restriction system protein
MLPVLRHCAEKVWFMRDLVTQIANDLNLSDAERSEQIPSGGTTVITSRVHWAKTYLKQAGLLEQPKRAYVEASARGRELLLQRPEKIDTALLQQFSEFRSFLGRTRSDSGSREPVHAGLGPAVGLPAPDLAGVAALPAPSSTPEEQIGVASRALSESLRDALLARILESSPSFFEKLIIDLLLAMGYGGSRTDAGEQLGGTGDGGVDGVIREDQLGLDRIYLQAKRYQPGNTVGSEVVQAFIGALVGKGAQKGVLITTSTFTKAALNAANQSGALRVVLIDGNELTRLMIRFNIGARVAQTVEIKRVDIDYFEVSETE